MPLSKLGSEQIEQIKRLIRDRIAPTYYGKIGLNDVFRVFSSRANKSDLERCCNELVNEREAVKLLKGDDVYYVFPSIVKEFKASFEGDLNKLKMEEDKIVRNLKSMREKLILTDKLQDNWLNNWGEVVTDDQYNSLNTYISSIYISNLKKSIKKFVNELEDGMLIIKNKIVVAENKLKLIDE